MLGEMSSRQMAEWRAFGSMEPIGDERADFRMAYALSVVVNMVMSALAPDAAPVNPADMMPRYLGDDEPYRDRLAATPVHPTVRAFEQMMGVQ